MQDKKRQSTNKKQEPPKHGTTQEVKALLRDLKQLHRNGAVSDEEFESGKSKLLESL